MRAKAIIQLVGAIVSGINVAGPLILDAQSIFPNWPWQYHSLIGFFVFVLVIGWVIYDQQSKIRENEQKYELVREIKQILRHAREQALELRNKQNLEHTEAELWVSKTATFIECAVGTPRKMDFLRSINGAGAIDWSKVNDVKRYLMLHANDLEDLADSLQQTDMRPNFKLKDLEATRKQVLGKEGSQS